jgi:hypothetical protein
MRPGIESAPTPGIMKPHTARSTALLTAGGLGVLGIGYLSLAAAAWTRFGHPRAALPDEVDPLLDRFIPSYEVVERHRVRVDAPAAVTLLTAKNAALNESLLVRGIFKARELALGARPAAATSNAGLLEQMQGIGWRVLAEIPDREVVVGAVTQPWMPNVVFRGIDPEEFRTFTEPFHVKIAWTLRVDPIDDTSCVFRTETRVVTTDADARSRFRWYWARFSPGIALIRRAMVQAVKTHAERSVPVTAR